MKVSRRHFLKMMLAAAGATALGWNAAAGLLQGCLARRFSAAHHSIGSEAN